MIVGVGTSNLCTKKSLAAGSPSERMVEVFSHILQTSDSIEKLRGTLYTRQSCTSTTLY